MKLTESHQSDKHMKKDKKFKKSVENGTTTPEESKMKKKRKVDGLSSTGSDDSVDSGMGSQVSESGNAEVMEIEFPNDETSSSKSKKKQKREKNTDDRIDSVDKKSKKKDKKKKEKSKAQVEKTIEQDINKIANGISEVDDINGEGGALTEEQRKGLLSKFRISPSTLEKLKERGVKYLFPIQHKTFDFVYDGKDVIGQARTGTGKTLSFALPLTEVLTKNGMDKKRGRAQKVLVLVPTRELAKQVADDFQSLSNDLAVTCVYGGTPYHPQESAIRSGIDVLVGTPGRINDHLEKGNLDFSKLQHVVLDEVDQMLDMGFADIVDQILKSAYEKEDHKPQTLLFSATMPQWVYETSKKYMNTNNLEHIKLVGKEDVRTATTVQHLAIKCGYFDRASTIRDILQVYSGKNGKAIIFNQTKKDADELAVSEHMKQDAHVLHGDIPQDKREMVLKGFRDGKYNVLITTDVAARGLDIPQIDLVIQCSPPKDVDSYIHRSGRTGRAGRSGVCILFYKPQEERDLNWVEQKARIKFKKIGAPSPEDIIKASAADAAKSLEAVSEDTLRYFESSAKELISERGAVSALSAALAIISGSTTIVSRSLLSSREGYTTYLFSTDMEMHSLGYAWRALERQIPEEIKEQFQRMRFCQNKKGCVFDVPADCVSTIEQMWTDGKGATLQKATELPDLLESYDVGFSPGGRGGFSQGGRGGFRGGKGRSNRGGGFRGRDRGEHFSRGRGFSKGSDSRGGRGGFKRNSNFGDGGAQNKRIKFDS